MISLIASTHSIPFVDDAPLMGTFGKSRKDICNDLGFSYYTFSDWVNRKKYPRMDKVEMLAGYFGIKKSDLIEEKDEQKQKTGIAVEIVVRLGEDRDFCEAVEMLKKWQN